MKLVDELVKYQGSINVYYFLNQILNINDTLYRAENKLKNYQHNLEFNENDFTVMIEYFSKRIALKIDYDLDVFIQTSDLLVSALSKNSLEYDIPIEFIKLLCQKDGDGYSTKIKHNTYSKLIFVPLKRMFRKNDNLSHKGYELFLSNEVEMIKLPNISTIDDLQNVLTGFSINLN